MKEYIVKKYIQNHYTIWNEFVANAKNATFLFHRDFIEYHGSRFEDFSLLIFDEKDNLRAILPANRVEKSVFSHQGLTYGGLVLNEKSKLSEVITIFQSVLEFLYKQGISNLEIKVIPSIYTEIPSDELEYLAFLCDAELFRKDSLSVIYLEHDYKISSTRKNEISKASKIAYSIREEQEFESFWNQVLVPNLEQKHKSKPVHSVEEISLLKNKFPKNIRQFNVYLKNEIVAGTTIFETDNVAHSQYISGNGTNNLSLDFLHHFLITNVFKNKKYFDFGISNENQGKNINGGLLFWKESFGARTITQSFYHFETKNYEKLNAVLL